MFPNKIHLNRHTARVPKGFSRHHVLEAINQRPMSGSEITDRIERLTNGFWKPSPGSIYPLLSWLQDNAHIRELTVKNGLKRYEITEKGKLLLQEQEEIKKKLRESGLSPSLIFEGLLFKMPPEKTIQLRDSTKRLILAFFKLGSTLNNNFSKKALDKVKEALDKATVDLEEINSALRSGKYE